MKTFSLVATFILVLLIAIEAVLLSQYASKKGILGVSAKIVQPAPTEEPETALSQVVKKSLEGTQGTYAVYIKNLKTGETYHLNEHRKFEAGSLYKLWIMATTYQQIKNESLKEDQTLSQSIPTLNAKFEIAKEDAELTEGTVTMTVNQALNQMITISHNYAAMLLTEKIKLSTANTYIKDNNYQETRLGGPPETTAADVALFYENVYQGKVVDQPSSQKMIELLKGQKLNDGMPKLLPSGIQVAHKTGDLGWFKHDAGIVFTDKGDYIFVALSESTSPTGAQQRIAQLSKDVYDYFNKK